MHHRSQELLPGVDVVAIEQLLKLLSAGQRLEILQLLADRPHCVNELADGLFQRCDAVSRDLKELRRAGLVSRQNDGVRRRYLMTKRVGVHGDEHGNQIAVTTSSGDWLLVHIHDVVEDADLVAPPEFMVGQPLWSRQPSKVS